jgi:hypothetical protein
MHRYGTKKAANIPKTFSRYGRPAATVWSKDRGDIQYLTAMLKDEDVGSIVPHKTFSDVELLVYRGYPVAKFHGGKWCLAAKGEPGRRLYDAVKRMEEERVRKSWER